MGFISSILSKIGTDLIWQVVHAIIGWIKENMIKAEYRQEFDEMQDRVIQKIKSAKTKQEMIDAARENARLKSGA